VENLIHHKYESIIEYLQAALRASDQDEETFQKSIGDLKGLVGSLQINKADKL